MPDPGEPHRPEREHFASDEDYLSALEMYVQLVYPPEEVALLWEAQLGVRDIEEFLEHRNEH
jgi:hypothetical protein